MTCSLSIPDDVLAAAGLPREHLADGRIDRCARRQVELQGLEALAGQRLHILETTGGGEYPVAAVTQS